MNCSEMHEYFPIDAKQNTVMADQLCCHACPEHRCLCAPYASKRVFNANSGSGNYKINEDVTGIVPDTKKTQLGGWVLLILLKQLLSEACLQRR